MGRHTYRVYWNSIGPTALESYLPFDNAWWKTYKCITDAFYAMWKVFIFVTNKCEYSQQYQIMINRIIHQFFQMILKKEATEIFAFHITDLLQIGYVVIFAESKNTTVHWGTSTSYATSLSTKWFIIYSCMIYHIYLNEWPSPLSDRWSWILIDNCCLWPNAVHFHNGPD